MGDAADYYDETAINEYALHLRGECDQYCPHCQEEEGPEQRDDASLDRP